MKISEDIVEQTEQCLKNIKETLEKADASLEDVIRVNYIVPVAADFEKCWPVLQSYFGDIRPAATRYRLDWQMLK